MKYAKRVMSLTLVMGLMVSSLTGCSSSKGDAAGSEGKTKIVFQMGTAPQEKITAAFEEVTDKFEAENPDIDVELLIGASGFEEVMKTKMAANDLPADPMVNVLSANSGKLDKVAGLVKDLL